MGLVMEGFRELQVFEIGLNCLKEAEEEALLYADPGYLNGGIMCDVTPQFHLLLCLWGDSSAGNDALGVCWEMLIRFCLLSLAVNNK